ncbi:MAG: RecX family transcriptional regulator, partial [Bacteroidia bacterium]|nr:RecX family transcriptional regulator [Bacteroidia bacterium]
MEEKKTKITDPVLALEKLRAWCSYQERCQQEARDKLYELGLWTDAVESIISNLISENYINEERF